MNYTKDQLIADIEITEGVIHGNSYYYNLFDCKTQKEKDVVRNAVNRERRFKELHGDWIYKEAVLLDIIEAEKKYKEESRAIAIKIFFGLIAIAGVIYSYLHM